MLTIVSHIFCRLVTFRTYLFTKRRRWSNGMIFSFLFLVTNAPSPHFNMRTLILSSSPFFSILVLVFFFEFLKILSVLIWLLSLPFFNLHIQLIKGNYLLLIPFKITRRIIMSKSMVILACHYIISTLWFLGAMAGLFELFRLSFCYFSFAFVWC